MESNKKTSDSSHVRVNIRVSPEVHQYFKQRSEISGASMSVLMFLALEKYVNEQSFMNGGLQQLLDIAKAQGLDKQLTDGERRLSEAVLDMERE